MEYMHGALTIAPYEREPFQIERVELAVEGRRRSYSVNRINQSIKEWVDR
jgi:outer membrane receptor for Fe3+-dicitrate